MKAASLAGQGATFVAVGIAATLTHLTAALAARHGLGLGPMIANFVGYSCSVAVSYLGNARFTFRRGAGDVGQFARFIVVSLAGLAVNQLIVNLLIKILHYPFLLALGVVVITVPPLTFVLSRLWAFKAWR